MITLTVQSSSLSECPLCRTGMPPRATQGRAWEYVELLESHFAMECSAIPLPIPSAYASAFRWYQSEGASSP